MGLKEILKQGKNEEGATRTRKERDRLLHARMTAAGVGKMNKNEAERRRLTRERSDLFNRKVYRERKARPIVAAVKRGEYQDLTELEG